MSHSRRIPNRPLLPFVLTAALSWLCGLQALTTPCRSQDAAIPKSGSTHPSSALQVLRRFHLPGVVDCKWLSPANGKILETYDPEGTIRWWNVETQRWVRTIKRPVPAGNEQVVYSPDRKRVAIAPADRKVQIRRVSDGRLLQRLAVRRSHEEVEGEFRMAFSPDGRLIAVHEGQTLCVWDARTGRRKRNLLTHYPDQTGDFAFSPDSKALAVVRVHRLRVVQRFR